MPIRYTEEMIEADLERDKQAQKEREQVRAEKYAHELKLQEYRLKLEGEYAFKRETVTRLAKLPALPIAVIAVLVLTLCGKTSEVLEDFLLW